MRKQMKIKAQNNFVIRIFYFMLLFLLFLISFLSYCQRFVTIFELIETKKEMNIFSSLRIQTSLFQSISRNEC